jgi:hypothetical protein
VPGTIIITEESATADLPYPSINPASLADGMDITVRIDLLDGSSIILCNFTGNFLGLTLDDLFTSIATEITTGGTGYTATCDTVNDVLSIVSTPGSGANYATISISVVPFFGIINTVPFTDEIDTLNPEYIFAYGNKYGGNLAGHTFYVDHNNNIITAELNGVNVASATFTLPNLGSVHSTNSIVYSPETDAVYFIDRSSPDGIFITMKLSFGMTLVNHVTLPQNITMLNQNFVYNHVDKCVYISDGAFGVFKIHPDDIANPTIDFIDVSSVSSGFLGNICVNEYTGDMILYPSLGNTGNTTLLRTDGTFSLATPFSGDILHRVSFMKGANNADSHYIFSYLAGVIDVRKCDDLSVVFSSLAASPLNGGVWYSEVLGVLIGRDSLGTPGKIFSYSIDIPNQLIVESIVAIDFIGIYPSFTSTIDQYQLEYDIPETGHVFVATQTTESQVDNNIYGVNIGLTFGSDIDLDGFFRGGVDEFSSEDNCLSNSQADLLSNMISTS